MRRRVLGVVLTSLVGGGCYFTTSLDDLAGGGSDPAPMDASADLAARPEASPSDAAATPEAGSSVAVVGFQVVNAQGTPIPPFGTLKDDDVLSKSTLGPFTIMATTQPRVVGSVVFYVDGSELHTEEAEPYTIVGGPGTYPPWNAAPKTYEIEAVPFSATSERGTSARVRVVVAP